MLRVGGHFLIANLCGFATASDIWVRRRDGASALVIQRYLEPHAIRAEWKQISVTNWHRPLSFYMGALLERGLRLCHFDEPAIPDPQDAKEIAYNGAPYLQIMEWHRDY